MRKRGCVGVLAIVLGSSTMASADKVIAAEATASSTAKAKGDKFAAWRAIDGSTGTAWCEGKSDEGAGETIKLTFAEPIKVTRIDLYVGLHGSAKEYSDNNRISLLSAQTAPKVGEPMVMLAKSAAITSKHDMLVKLDLKSPRTIQVLELGLAGVTRGGNLKVDNTCITDISLVAEKNEVVSFLYGLSADAISQLPAAINVLQTAVAGCEEKVLAYAVKYPLEQNIQAEEDSRTVKHKNVKALVKACKAKAFPTIPNIEDKPELSPAGLARVRLETGGSDLTHMEMQWTDGGWKLVAVQTY